MIFGAGALGKAALEIFTRNGVVTYGLLDDDASTHGEEIGEVTVLGRTDDDGYLKFIGQKAEAFVAVEDRELRKHLVEMLKDRRKVMPVNAVHPTAEVATTAIIGNGNFINARAIVGSVATLGNHCVLHSGSVVDHGAKLDNFVQVGAGAVVNAGVQVGKDVFIGSGSILVSGIKVGKGARIGAGSVVVADVKAGDTVFGNPAQSVKA